MITVNTIICWCVPWFLVITAMILCHSRDYRQAMYKMSVVAGVHKMSQHSLFLPWLVHFTTSHVWIFLSFDKHLFLWHFYLVQTKQHGMTVFYKFAALHLRRCLQTFTLKAVNNCAYWMPWFFPIFTKIYSDFADIKTMIMVIFLQTYLSVPYADAALFYALLLCCSYCCYK